MPEPMRVALVGSTGLVGRSVIEAALGRDEIRLVAIARREAPLPQGARMEMIVADPAGWGEAIEVIQPDAMICALGTTWKQAGKDEAKFRAVDQDLVLSTARAALAQGVANFAAISSAGASPTSKNLYLRVKGEVERDLRALKFKRLDILRPGLLKGARQGELRFAETLGKIASPLTDMLLQGNMRRYRSIQARMVAEAALELVSRKAAGRFTHDNDAIRRAARDWNKRHA